MAHSLHTLPTAEISNLVAKEKETATEALESGKVIYLPNYSFTLNPTDQVVLSETILSPQHKNISYDYLRQKLAGTHDPLSSLGLTLKNFIHRYAEFAQKLVHQLLPQYQEALVWGRTSYRPAEIKGRTTSKRQDDTRLHVDAFPSTPVHSQRILRIFCNINPFNEPRVWHLGEPFAQVISQFAETLPAFNPIIARILNWIKATKSLRSAYDHYMLKLHDTMKLSDRYQQQVNKQRVDFPPYSTWLVFTDHVSHAALSGQFLLEQTFYLPVSAMKLPEHAPLTHWEKYKGI